LGSINTTAGDPPGGGECYAKRLVGELLFEANKSDEELG
jgi:hypothetical protein